MRPQLLIKLHCSSITVEIFMKIIIPGVVLLSALSMITIARADSINNVHDEASLIQAVSAANSDPGITTISFNYNAAIQLTAPVIYSGTQSLKLIGNKAVIDGASAGSFILDENLTAVTTDGTLVFNSSADIDISNLTVINSATRGIVINVPADATGDNISVNLYKVDILDSALFGLHIDDNVDEFDDGNSGSKIGIDLKVTRSSFTGNGTGAIDFDGVRVDERAEGSINVIILSSRIDRNGGDGIELDEAGNGDVYTSMVKVSMDGNGYYNEDDLDDGIDIDEAGPGGIEFSLVNVSVNDNKDEGIDLDETGEGSIEVHMRRVTALNNADEGIKIDEEDDGDIETKLHSVSVTGNGDDGIQFTELDEGKIDGKLRKANASDNAKYGITMEQWLIEDEAAPAEDPGTVKIRNTFLSGNGKGNKIKTNNIYLN